MADGCGALLARALPRRRGADRHRSAGGGKGVRGASGRAAARRGPAPIGRTAAPVSIERDDPFRAGGFVYKAPRARPEPHRMPLIRLTSTRVRTPLAETVGRWLPAAFALLTLLGIVEIAVAQPGADPATGVPGFWDPRRRPERPDI